MKALKKLSCILLVVLLMLSLSTTAFATAGGTGTISVDNAIPGQTYTAYRILDFTPVDAADTETGESSPLKGLYTIAKGWEGFFAGDEYGAKVFDLNGIEGADEYVTPKKDAEGKEIPIDAKTLAEAALAYAKEHDIPYDEQVVAPGSPYKENGEAADRVKVQMENMPLGYYVVDSTAGALVALDTAGANVTMHEKNEIPTINKEVQENSNIGKDGEWGDKNDAEHKNNDGPNVGDSVKYRTTITVRTGGVGYVLHDKMDDGLTFDGVGSVKVQIGGVDVDAENYTVTAPGSDGDTFDITFSDAYIATLADKTEIVVTYSATINENAEVKVPEINDTYLSFGEDNETVHDKTETYTYGLNIFKYIGNNDDPDSKDPLEGAKFVLKKEIEVTEEGVEGTTKKTVYAQFAEGWLTGWAEATTDEDGKITYPAGSEMVTDAAGKVPEMKGLDAGSYTLEETEAPAGYNKADPIPVVIDHDGNATANGAALDAANTVNVPNYTGLELPETGGIGTTIFYTVGGVLVAVALILLVTKKRARSEQ